MTGAVSIPQQWYDVVADLPELDESYVDSASGQRVGTSALTELFAPELVEQELHHPRRLVPIPEPILEMYARWRPTPLVRARGLEQALNTRCRIYYKYEGSSPIGSHKANSGVAQAYYTHRAGRKRVFAETGAGQWGSAISMGSSFFGLNCSVFMVGGSYDSKPARRTLMETFGSRVHRSPSRLTEVGRANGADDTAATGSLGLAIGEAVEAARQDEAAAYGIGSAFNFVCLHQTVIGQELRAQLDAEGIQPDVLVSCIGGGSSYAGLVFPFVDQVRPGGRGLDLVAVESNAVPKVTRGVYAYDHGDSAKLTPLSKMYTLGHEFAAPGIHSGGLRYHGLAPQVSKLINMGLGRAVAYPQLEVFRSAALFARAEGLVPAPEAAHSIAAVVELARTHRSEERVLVFCLTGHGFFDLAAYDKFNRGTMEDSDSPDSAIARSLRALPTTPDPSTSHPGGPAGTVADPFEAWRRWHFAARQPAPLTPSGPAASAAPATDGVDLSRLRVVTAPIVREATRSGPGDLLVGEHAVVTPAAEAQARELNRRLVRCPDRAGQPGATR
ncbi:TrpB-like pyridoxal phosphate-dependent enzyme [Plantactinospora sp. B6F1]|uniref:TrpB-like pyridoxal phosphate-dependent enzyme n=1 Tax=Plantactinospora sp. B6F1 TaxID=3158971 RepID=UPI0032D8CE81